MTPTVKSLQSWRVGQNPETGKMEICFELSDKAEVQAWLLWICAHEIIERNPNA